MMARLLGDPIVRRAYLVTKAAVVLLAGLVSWPLSRVLGAEVWLGYGVFVAVMAALAVLILTLGGGGAPKQEREPEEDPEGRPPPGPDDGAITIPIEDVLDLHPFPPRDVPAVVGDYLEAAHERGLRQVRLIHGRGIGVQRERVRSLLARHPLVESFADAPPSGGGWGATIATLREAPGPPGSGSDGGR